jgi:putative inorganic carbon (HCO3(-)) transporter
LPAGLVIVVCLLIPALLAYTMAVGNPFVAMALLCGMAAAILILARPFVGLVLFVTMVYVRPEDLYPPLQGMQLTLLIAVVTLVGAWIELHLKRDRIVRSPLNGLLIGFLAMAVISTVSGGSPTEAASDVGKLVILALLIHNLVRTPDRYRIFTTVVVALTTYVATRGIYLFMTDSTFCQEGDVRRAQGQGVFGNPNDLAAVIVPGFAFALVAIKQSPGWKRALFLLTLIPMTWIMLLTNSRGGLLGLMVVLIATFVFGDKNKVRALVLTGVACVLVLTLASGRMKNFDNKEASANSRFSFWANAVTVLGTHPATGVGYNRFDHYNGGMAAHNTLVTCFVELGVVGYYFWIGCLYYCFRRRTVGESSQPPDEAAAASLFGARVALIGYLVSAFFGNYTYSPISYVILSLPIVQQMVFRGNGVLFPLNPKERFRDFVVITAVSLGSIVFIRFFAQALM